MATDSGHVRPSGTPACQAEKRLSGYSLSAATGSPQGLHSLCGIQCPLPVRHWFRAGGKRGKVQKLRHRQLWAGHGTLVASCPADHTACEDRRRRAQERTRTCPKGRGRLTPQPCHATALASSLPPGSHTLSRPHQGLRGLPFRAPGRVRTGLLEEQESTVPMDAKDPVQSQGRWPHGCPAGHRPPNTAARLTMSTHACFPSMKPLGMEFGVRISYLRKRRTARSG